MKYLLLFLGLFGAACGSDTTLVVANRLAPGGGVGGDGGTGFFDGATLEIVVKIESNATDFDPEDLMRLRVNGVERQLELAIGGEFAVLALVPPPVGAPQFVELFRRTSSTTLDTFTYESLPYTGPTLDSVDPNTARVGTQVTIHGTGFLAGPLRVFFGGFEGTVDASTDTTITATVPVDAEPGLVYVLVAADAAEGLVGFQPTDLTDAAVPPPTGGDPVLYAAFPGNGRIETAVRVYGLNLDDEVRPLFNDRRSSDIFGFEVVTVDPIGDVIFAYAVVKENTDFGAGELILEERGRDESRPLPFTVKE